MDEYNEKNGLAAESTQSAENTGTPTEENPAAADDASENVAAADESADSAEDAALGEELEGLRKIFQEKYDEATREAELGELPAPASEEKNEEKTDADVSEDAEKASEGKKDGPLSGSFVISKKLVAVIAAVVVVIAAVAIGVSVSRSSRSPEVTRVIAMINGLGDVGADSGDELEAARQAYLSLSSKDRRKVSNYRKLEKAEEEFDEITAFNDRVLAIVNASKGKFTQSSLDFTALAEDGKNILAEYEKMDDARRASVVPEIENVEDALGIIEYCRGVADECARAYVSHFLELYSANGYRVTDLGCIMYFREGRQYLLYALTADNGSKTRNYYSHVPFENADQFGTDDFAAMVDHIYETKPVSEDRDPLTGGNVALDLAGILGDDYEPATEATEAPAASADAEAEETEA